jgi:hypothetical protein
MKILPIPREQTLEWLLKKHYAKRVPSISYAFGLFDESKLVGICTYGSPASPSLCTGICGESYKDIVLELNRLCIEEPMPKNTASFFVSQTLKLLPKPRIIVSYADKAMGHVGKIYQATNFLYTGASVERTDIDTGDKHSRHYEKGGDYSKRKFRSSKHRYIYFLGSKVEVKRMKKTLNYKVLSYPTGQTQRYDANYSPMTINLLFV